MRMQFKHSNNVRIFALACLVLGQAAFGLQLYRTDSFEIRHDASEPWAAGLGAYLDSFETGFYAELIHAGLLAAADVPLAGHRLNWQCEGMAAASSGGELRFRANYDTRLHQVNLRWMPAAEPAAVPAETAAYVPDGLFAPDCDREVLLTRLSHEAAHQLAFECGLQTRGVMYPLWVAEGLATNFESPDERVRFLGPNPVRRTRLEAIAREEALMPLDALGVIADVHGLPSDERIDIYAQVWGFFRFLAMKKPIELSAYLHTLSELPYGRRTENALLQEMQDTFGPLAQLDQEWRSWAGRK